MEAVTAMQQLGLEPNQATYTTVIDSFAKANQGSVRPVRSSTQSRLAGRSVMRTCQRIRAAAATVTSRVSPTTRRPRRKRGPRGTECADRCLLLGAVPNALRYVA